MTDQHIHIPADKPFVWPNIEFARGKEILVIYSPHSIDSMLATGIMAIYLSGKASMTTLSYDRLVDTNSLNFSGFDYVLNTSRALSEMDTKRIEAEYEAKFVDWKNIHDSKDNYVFSASYWALQLFRDTDTEDTPEELTELVGAVHKYCTFTTLTKHELMLVYDHIPNIKEGCLNVPELLDTHEMTPFTVRIAADNYDVRLQALRSIIKRNFTKRLYNIGTSGFIVPTLSASQEDAFDIMRQVRYAHEEVITYEDIRDARIFRIITARNAEWYTKCFKAHDVWYEDSVLYISAAVPNQDR